MGSLSLFRPYYYGEQRWDNYLLDVQKAIDKSTQQQGEVMAQRLSEQNESLLRINETLENGLEEMRSEFHWGFTLMIHRMDRQIEMLFQIADRLDAIHKTLKSPLMTQARELFDLGQEQFSKGLWEEARESFLKAEEKNRAHFPLQLQLGTLLLCGTGSDSNVVNVEEARKHLLLAARYAQAEVGTVPQSKKYFGKPVSTRPKPNT